MHERFNRLSDFANDRFQGTLGKWEKDKPQLAKQCKYIQSKQDAFAITVRKQKEKQLKRKKDEMMAEVRIKRAKDRDEKEAVRKERLKNRIQLISENVKSGSSFPVGFKARRKREILSP